MTRQPWSAARWRVAATVAAILAAWLALHGARLDEMAHRTVLDMRPQTAFTQVPVDLAFRSQLVLPREAINFRPEMMGLPVCVVIDLSTGRQASGGLIFRVTHGSTVLAETRLDAHEITNGDNRVCLDLALGQLSPVGTALEVSADPQRPVQAISVLMGSPQKHAEEPPVPVIRLIAQAPWGARQLVSTAVVCALVLSILATALRALWGGSQPVK